MNILIIGYGNIGKHIYNELNPLKPCIYDPNNPRFSKYPNKQIDIAFICVPTDSLPDGSCDLSIVDQVVQECTAKIIVIKSAVPVGTTEMLANKYNKRIIISPEYYGTTQHSSNSPEFLILGGNISDCVEVAQIFYKVKNGKFRIMYTTAKTAELAKYMENCFLALKVTFCNEFAQVAADYEVPYELLREAFVMDERMGDSHTFVLDEQPFYDSHCLNKDVPAFLHMANGKAPLMKSVYQINQQLKIENQYYKNNT